MATGGNSESLYRNMGENRRRSRVKKAVSVTPMSTGISLAVETNEDFDRKMTVVGKIVEGTIPLQSSFTITQLGLREGFIPADSDEGFQDSTGVDYGVLKE